MARDKVYHVIAGFLIAVICGWFYPIVGFVIAILAGCLKEAYDMFYPNEHTAELEDAVATGVGGLAGYICMLVVHMI